MWSNAIAMLLARRRHLRSQPSKHPPQLERILGERPVHLRLELLDELFGFVFEDLRDTEQHFSKFLDSGEPDLQAPGFKRETAGQGGDGGARSVVPDQVPQLPAGGLGRSGALLHENQGGLIGGMDPVQEPGESFPFD